MRYVLFEDRGLENLFPLVYFRPVWELRCGAETLVEKWEHALNGAVYFSSRKYLMEYYLPQDRILDKLDQTEEVIWLNGRWLFDPEWAAKLPSLSGAGALTCQGELLAFRASPAQVSTCLSDGVLNADEILSGRKPLEIKAKIAHYAWDLMEWNGSEIEADFRRQEFSGTGPMNAGEAIHFIQPKQIHIESDAKIEPGVVIDASDGPVWIDSGAKIMAQAVIKGPAYIGKNTQIKIGAKIYPDTSIGPMCKIGGEVEGSIIQGYSNKQHEGFLGHAFLARWVNLGADTNNSDLKNNYGEIRVLLNGREVNTGRRFLGLIMGDHSKCAINTMFNTGTIVGVNCNIFGAGMPPKFVPSFSWGGAGGFVTYDLKKAMAVAKKVMERRNISFSTGDEQLFQIVEALAGKVELKES